jgi:hypothetical protein
MLPTDKVSQPRILGVNLFELYVAEHIEDKGSFMLDVVADIDNMFQFQLHFIYIKYLLFI